MKNYQLLTIALLSIFFQSTDPAQCKEFMQRKESIPDSLFKEQRAPLHLDEPHVVPKGELVSPPGEEMYFPVREDGQDYIVNLDSTVNMTQALNEFYYDPKWRGEVWAPFDQYTLLERASRRMGTWKEYDEFSELRIMNKWHKFWERASGFGP